MNEPLCPELRFDLDRRNGNELPPDPATWDDDVFFFNAFPGGLEIRIGDLTFDSGEDPMFGAAIRLFRLVRDLKDGETRGFEWIEDDNDLLFSRSGDMVRVFSKEELERWGVVDYQTLLDAVVASTRDLMRDMIARVPALERNSFVSALATELDAAKPAEPS